MSNLTLERKRSVFTSVTFQTVRNSWEPLRIKINTVPSVTVSLLVALTKTENRLIDPVGLAKHHP